MGRFNIFFSIIFFTSVITQLWAQQADSLKAFYPLHVGDLWEYEINESGFIYKASTKITGDTTLENGKKYFIRVYNDDFGTFNINFSRITDSLEVVAYFSNSLGTGERLVYKLDAQKGDTWASSDSLSLITVTLDSTFEEEMFGEIRPKNLYRLKRFNKNTGEFVQEMFNHLTFGIGFSHLSGGDGIAEIGRWTLTGAIIDGKEFGEVTSVKDLIDRNYSKSFSLFQNYPNPFNSETKIEYEVNRMSQVYLSIIDIIGREVITLVNKNQYSGHHHIVWNGKSQEGGKVASGVYFCQLRVDNEVHVRKLLLLR